MICIYFSNSADSVFTYLMVSFDAQKFLSLMNIIYFPLLLVFLVSYQRNHCQIQSHEDLPFCFLLSILYF